MTKSTESKDEQMG